MVYQVRLARRALRDLTHIYRYVQAEISERASSWFDGLEKAIYSLERYPERGPITPEDRKLRHLLYGRRPHVCRIIYEIKKRSSRVDVLHIRHGARDKMPRR